MEKLFNLTLLFIILGFCSCCIPSEREALLKFKTKLKDPSNRLHSWDDNGDCCEWYGVICSNFSSHVIELHLQSLSMEEYFGYGKSTFGGEISSSLLNLNHLRYLDLSHNNFELIPIPKFLGSLRSLRYINLYGARFGGIIPHELGKLSNLVYLNLNGDYDFYGESVLSIDSLDWVSGLSMLEFLDLSSVDFSESESVNWLELLNKLPSLVELYLSYCLIVRFPPPVNLNFSSLSVLDLSGNDFVESSIPNWVFGLQKLKTLNLADNLFEGPISHHYQNMTSLQKLDLSSNIFPSIPKWILSRNLISLNLSGNGFGGPVPSELQNVSSIKELDLSRNGFNSSIPDWLYDFRHLEILNLARNSLSGKISSAIQNMTSLTNLDLSRNVEFEGGIPKSFKHLCTLESLSFSQTKLGQEMNDILNILSGSSNLLKSLDLSHCELSGKLNNQLGDFKNLIYLSLLDNSISGSIPLTLAELKSLRFLSLYNNKLDGTVPEGLGGLEKLEHIDISYNLLEGVVSEMHLANLTNLSTLDGSMNRLILEVSSYWIPPFLQLRVLKLRSWDIGIQFPNWFYALKYVKVLDLSNSNISSTIPNWFWNSSFQFSYLNLSHNQIHGSIILDVSLTSDVIDLSSNLFEGPLPHILSDTTFLDLSNNSFSGSISHFICHKIDEQKRIYGLDLGNNLLTGKIPDCWSNNWIYLASLRLSNNNFSGNIPKSIGDVASLSSLHLWNNSLSGELPMTLQNCGSLKTLDLGKNELTGQIPSWISSSFSSLMTLILGGNKFHGKIPKEICQLKSLQILDLSNNSLSGDIPNCINNFTFMAIIDSQDQYYDFGISGYGEDIIVIDGATIMMKGRRVEYQSILRFVRILDFSSNNLSGEIPKEITTLLKLQSLNLSNNFLSGEIPEDIGSMRGLEALDFSQNQLNGRIPQSMTSLTFLSTLNLSYNNLTGMIPTGTQLQSFPASSFNGNQGLMGPPLTDNSTANGTIPPDSVENAEKGDEVDWGLYVSMAVGFVVGFWSILCPLFLNRRWRHLYYLFLASLWNRIWWRFRC